MDLNKIKAMKKQGGFTLIELLVVVAIIGILSAIAIPQYQSYAVGTAEAACESEVNSYRSSVEAHLLDSNRYDAPTVPSNYEGSCESISFDIASTSGEASSITGTYKSPASGTFTIERDSNGVWSVDDGLGGTS